MQIPEPDADPDDTSEEVFSLEKLKSKNSLAYGLYTQLQLHKYYFSQMQNKCRNLCSTWLIAAFIGIGFLISKNTHLDTGFDNLLAILIVCICTICGITLIWHLDIVFYQKFWLATVVEMARMEQKHRWMPPVNLNILSMRRHKKLRFFQGFFYVMCNSLFVFIMGLCAFFYFTSNHMMQLIIAVLTPLLIIETHQLMMKRGMEYEGISTHSFR